MESNAFNAMCPGDCLTTESHVWKHRTAGSVIVGAYSVIFDGVVGRANIRGNCSLTPISAPQLYITEPSAETGGTSRSLVSTVASCLLRRERNKLLMR